MPIRTPTTLIATAFALLIAGTAAAAGPKKEGSFGTGEPTGPVLTKEQLRVCLDRQARVSQQRSELLKEQGALVDAQAELQRNGEALKARLEALDRTNAQAVAAYNADAQAREKQIDAHDTRVTAFNARAEANRVEREEFAKSCENRRYLEYDEIAIRKGK